jgi:hypothetical protein
MSHSRILVIDNSEYDVDEMFEEMQSYGNGVDYIDDTIETKQEDFDWFMNYVSSMGFGRCCDMNSTMKFKIFSINAFWDKMTRDIKQIMEDDDGVTEMNRFELEDRLGMKRGFWIHIDGELYTLPYFMRTYGKMTGKEFEVTKILDYHM